jgi:POT family proton-dependent oligopeptide transporter
MIGYAVMALPGENALFLGLTIVILGNGLFKPNVSGIVGELYSDHDPRRDGGFTLFYMGINIGSLIPPLFIGAMVAFYGWGSGFLLAAFGMIVAIVLFVISQKKFHIAHPAPPAHKRKRWFYPLFIVGLIATAILSLCVLNFPEISTLLLIVAALAIIFALVLSILREEAAQRRRLVACLILTLLSVGFWAIYNQTFTSLMLFADRNMGKEWLGLTIDAEFTQFFNPFFIILLSPILSRLWISLDETGKDPSTPTKFSLGILAMAIGFLFLGVGTRYFSTNGIASPWWLVISYAIQTVGELLLSPIGLAMITRLSPRHMVGMMMGVWFLTNAAAFAIGAGLANFASVPATTPLPKALAIYTHAFFLYGLLALALALLNFSLIPYLKRLIHSAPQPIATPKK